jgi:hypothetical protein
MARVGGGVFFIYVDPLRGSSSVAHFLSSADSDVLANCRK